MRVSGLWRYPVKSLGGEALPSTGFTAAGIPGDRSVHVAGPHGPLTGRTRPGLLTVPATTGPDGEPLVAGHPWRSTAAAGLVRAAAGAPAELVPYDGPERFDVLNLLVVTDGSVAEFGYDLRRLRPNLLIEGVPAGAEHHWTGRALAVGDAVIGVYQRRSRCVVTTIDPDTGAQDLDVLRHIRHRFDHQLGLDCWVIRPGAVKVGDPVTLLPGEVEPERVGGWTVGRPYAVPRLDRADR
jgi:MOSC domain-containing protein